MKHITIIGGGLGGLTAGALLAKKGYRITLLEQHTIVGGCASTFYRKGGFTCEVGLHKMDGVYNNPTIARIFHTLGIYDAVQFVKSKDFFTVTTARGTYTLPYGIQEATHYLITHFPHESKGITAYFRLIDHIGKEIDKMQNLTWYHYLLFPFLFWHTLYYRKSSVTEVLDRLIKDETLKLILNANVQYYNDHPDTLSFILHAKAQSSFFHGGGWFIKGGSSRLSNHLATIITSEGGQVLTTAMVTACTPTQVTFTHKKHTQTLETDLIVSNLSPEDTYALFNHPYREKRAISNGLCTLYLGFSQNLKTVYGSRPYTNFFFDSVDTLHRYKTLLKKDISQRGFGFTDYAQIDAGLTKEAHKSFAVACTTDYIEAWEELDEEAYRQKKATLISTTIERLEKHYPGIGALVEYAEVATAKTQKRYLKTPQGTAYGYKPTPQTFFHIPRSHSREIENLYFVGQWVIAGGFSPALLSGELCAMEIAARSQSS